MEKIQTFAKSFGLIRIGDDIALKEAELVNLDKSRRSFGMVMVNKPVDTPMADPDKEHAAQFMRMTTHLSFEDRAKLMSNMV